jgi:hypothetical protein
MSNLPLWWSAWLDAGCPRGFFSRNSFMPRKNPNYTPVAKIYLIKCNDIPMYIGCTTQQLLSQRLACIRDAAIRNRKTAPIHAAIRNNPDADWTIEALETSMNIDYAFDILENKWIDEFRNQGYNILNIKDGGKCGYKSNMSAEHKANLASAVSAANKERWAQRKAAKI